MILKNLAEFLLELVLFISGCLMLPWVLFTKHHIGIRAFSFLQFLMSGIFYGISLFLLQETPIFNAIMKVNFDANKWEATSLFVTFLIPLNFFSIKALWGKDLQNGRAIFTRYRGSLHFLKTTYFANIFGVPAILLSYATLLYYFFPELSIYLVLGAIGSFFNGATATYFSWLYFLDHLDAFLMGVEKGDDESVQEWLKQDKANRKFSLFDSFGEKEMIQMMSSYKSLSSASSAEDLMKKFTSS